MGGLAACFAPTNLVQPIGALNSQTKPAGPSWFMWKLVKLALMVIIHVPKLKDLQIIIYFAIIHILK